MKKTLNDESKIIIRGKRVKLIPTEDQENLFWQFAGTRRFIYNWGLRRKTEAWISDGLSLTFNDLYKEILYLKDHDPEYMWLKNISCDVAKQALKDLFSAFDRYFKKTKELGYRQYSKTKIEKSKRTGKSLTVYDRNGYPKFKKKLNCEEGFHQDCCQVKFKDDMVLISRVGWVKIAKTGIFPIGYGRTDFKLYNCKVKTDGIDWYFVAGVEVNCCQNSNEPDTEYGNPIGIDLGIKDLAILSDGTKYKNINKTKKIKQLEKRKRRLQRQVSRKYERNKIGDKYVKTKNSIKLQRKILKITKHLDGIRKDYRHKITSEIVKREPIFICMEDLNVSGMMNNRHLSKSISDQGIGYFRKYMEYKCEERNIPLYFADRWYPSSKTCSCCGYINKELKLKDRIYNCPSCGKSFDRDINASINLMEYGKKIYMESINQAK